MARRKHRPEVIAAVVLEYRAYKANGGVPVGWIGRKAAELGVYETTIYAYVRDYEEPAPPLPKPVVSRRSHFDHEAAMRGGGTLSVHASKWEE